MAEIVAAAAVVHAPQLLSRPPHEDLAKLDRSTAALRQFGDVLAQTRPDAVILIGLDHLETFWLEAVPAFTIVLSPTVTAHYMAEEATVRVDTDLATRILHGVIERDFDLTYSQDALLGHAFLTPLKYVFGGTDVPVVPLLVNTYLPPIPSPRRAHALGQAIAEAIADHPGRIAVVASGGMSHFPGTARYTAPNYAFDEWVVSEVERGRYEDLLGLSPVNLDEVGESELMTWFVLLGIIGQRPGTLLSYQELSHHGHGVVQFLPSSPRPRADVAPPPRYGGHEFTFTDHEYYRFPDPASIELNRLLHRIVVDAEYRAAFVRDRRAVLLSSGVGADERTALADNDDFLALTALGAHPLLALSARQVSEIEQRRQSATDIPTDLE
jgi:2,3-dihydroxyphenylpropionate 1,2-dioxygenase